MATAAAAAESSAVSEVSLFLPWCWSKKCGAKQTEEAHKKEATDTTQWTHQPVSKSTREKTKCWKISLSIFFNFYFLWHTCVNYSTKFDQGSVLQRVSWSWKNPKCGHSIIFLILDIAKIKPLRQCSASERCAEFVKLPTSLSVSVEIKVKTAAHYRAEEAVLVILGIKCAKFRAMRMKQSVNVVRWWRRRPDKSEYSVCAKFYPPG